MNILGLGGSHHDFGACVVVDGDVVCAVEEERLTRVKLAVGLGPRLQRCLAAGYVLRDSGLDLADIDLIVANDLLNPVYAMRFRDQVRWIGHHVSHAASAFYTSPFEASAVMVVDGRGSILSTGDGTVCETVTFYRADDRRLAPLVARTGHMVLGETRPDDRYEDSVGWMYEIVTGAIGFERGHGLTEPGKTMGLAPYGGPRYCADLGELFAVRDGHFRQSLAQQDELRRWLARELGRAATDEQRDEIRADLAHAVQYHCERIVIELVRWLHKQTGDTRLCLAGGVALNSVANFKILEETPFEELYVVPAAADNGTSLGAALYGHYQLAGHRWQPASRPFSPYLGHDYGPEEIADALGAVADRVSHCRPPDLDDRVAAALADGAVVGWFQGRSEIGPRALGNRSILADPRLASMKDRVNAKVKHREAFRPFAPVVRQQRQGEYFGTTVPAPYMLIVPPVHPDKRAEIPAVTHVDGTARLQTAVPELNPRLDRLLAAFERITGVPVLLNTSFNDRNEPIVETPADALRCFLGTEMDLLVLGDTLVRKADAKVGIGVEAGAVTP